MEYNEVRNLHWSPSEKKIARALFDQALEAELRELLARVQAKVAEISQPAQLRELETFLTKRRERMDAKYDYRYSQLPFVFALLLSEGRIQEQDMIGLSKEKRDEIRRQADMLRDQIVKNTQ